MAPRAGRKRNKNESERKGKESGRRAVKRVWWDVDRRRGARGQRSPALNRYSAC